MIPVGLVWESVLRANRVRTADIQTVVKDECNKAYYELCSMTSWVSLRKQITLDFNDAADSTGLWLPSDLVHIDDVRDNDAEVLYLPRDEASLDPEDETPRWYYSDVVNSPLVVADDGLSVSQNGSTFSFFNALSESMEDEYLKINGKLGYYKITSSNTTSPTFSPRYRDESLVDVGYQIRPDGTRKISLVNADNVFDENEVTVYYWAFPPTLDQADQMILLPNHRPLELLTLIRIIGTHNKRELSADRYRAEYESELRQMFSKNPAFGGPNWSRDKRGRSFAIGRNGLFKNMRPY